MKIHLLALASVLLLSSCDKGPDLAQLCTENPKICNEFAEDNWCRQERKDVAFARYDLKQTAQDKAKYNLLVAYEHYAKCMNHASKIENIKLKQKKRIRIDNYLSAIEKIKILSEQTKNSEHPELLFYHWSRYLNEEALNKFLALEGTAELETTESQFNLATYYIKRDLEKTLRLLFRALELLKPEADINIEILKTLTTIYTDKGEFKQAYVWLKILSLYAPEDETINANTLDQYAKGNNLDREFLDRVAQATLTKIQMGEFVSPRH
jgi:Protein of unknown function (DUF2989)